MHSPRAHNTKQEQHYMCTPNQTTTSCGELGNHSNCQKVNILHCDAKSGVELVAIEICVRKLNPRPEGQCHYRLITMG
jgi:hypothetical protein